MSKELVFILVAALGAICLEVMQWVELRRKISVKEKKILSSGFYWILTILMVIFSGVGTYMLFFDSNMQLKVPFVLGAAFPAIFKKAVNLSQTNKLPKLGGDPEITFAAVAKKYFQ